MVGMDGGRSEEEEALLLLPPPAPDAAFSFLSSPFFWSHAAFPIPCSAALASFPLSLFAEGGRAKEGHKKKGGKKRGGGGEGDESDEEGRKSHTTQGGEKMRKGE